MTYAVVEQAGEFFSTIKTADTGTITTTEAEAKFTNIRKTGDLTINKQVVSPVPAEREDKAYTFTVTLNDRTITKSYTLTGEDSEADDVDFTNGVATVKVKGNKSVTIEGLPIGLTWTVEEARYVDFDTTFSAKGKDATTTETCASGTIDDTTEAGAEYTNTRKLGDLSVTKTIESSTASDKDTRFTFIVTLSDTTISGKFGEDDKVMTFENGVATFELADGETMIATGLPQGIGYTVTETNVNGFTNTVKTGDTGTISATLSEAKFTNTHDEGDLVVSKKVVSDVTADHTAKFNIKVTLTASSLTGTYGDMVFTDGVATFELANGESKTAAGLPNGMQYTVEETNVDRTTYIVSYTGETGSIEKDKTASAIVTNTRKKGELEISKVVVSPVPAERSADYTFNIELSEKITGTYSDVIFNEGKASVTVKGGESKNISDLPVRITWTVEEIIDETVFTTEVNSAAANEANGVISADKSTAAFTNTRKTSELTVKKSVVSDAEADKGIDFDFTVTLTDTTIDGTFGEMTFESGVAEFSLKHGESKTADGLPVNIGYTVTEADNDAYTTERTDANGIVGEQSEVQFTNTRKLGALTIAKNVEVVGETEADSDYRTAKTEEYNNREFYVSVFTQINGTTWYVTNSNGVLSKEETFLTVKASEPLEIINLPVGNYTVKEKNDVAIANLTFAVKDSVTVTTQTVSSENPAKTELVNAYTYDVGSLKITKHFTGLKADEDGGELIFTITGVDQNEAKVYEKTFEFADFTDGVLVIENLVPGTYTVVEQDPENLNPDYTWTGTVKKAEKTVAKDALAEVEFTNDYELNTVEVSATKVWVDGDDADGLRNDVTLRLYSQLGSAEATEVTGSERTIPKGATGEALTVRWENLRKSMGGVDYVYTVVEDQLEGYTTSIALVNDEGGVATYTVTNKHIVPTTIQFGGTKVFEKYPTDKTPPTFTFKLMDSNGNELQTKTTVGAGSFDFDAITYTNAGEFTYTVSELSGTAGGVTYDSAVYTVIVTVVENADGTLTATKAFKKGDEAVTGITYENTYSTDSTSIQFGGMKAFDSYPADKTPPTFTFKLKDGRGVTIQTKTTTGAGDFDFDAITYTQAGEYTYTVYEQSGTAGGVSYDDAEFTVIVTVVDNGDGTLTATKSFRKDKDVVDGITFTNTYLSKPVTAQFGGTKVFDNFPTDKTVPTFTFELKEGTEVRQTKTTTGAGSFSFDAISYTKPGEYTYTVDEFRGGPDNIIYDDTVYTVVVTVEDDGSGSLTATTAFRKDGETVDNITFVNEYEVISLSGTKTWLDSREIHTDPRLELKRRAGEGPEEIVDVRPTWSGKGKVCTYTYSDLPKCDDKGVEYSYSVDEVVPKGYTMIRKGNDFINIELISVVVNKQWLRNGRPVAGTPLTYDYKEIREIKIALYSTVDGSDREMVETYQLTEANKWTRTINDLPKYDANGNEIIYTVEELEKPDGYSVEVVMKDGVATITNNINVDAFPETGGSGTGLYYGAGAALLILAVVLLFIKRKRNT